MSEFRTNENTPYKNSLDTEDFLAFSDSSPASEFAPSISSSPQKQWYNNSRNNSPYNSNRRSGNFRYNSQNNSPYNLYKFNNSFEYNQQNSNYHPHRNRNSKFNRSKNDSFSSGKNDSLNISNYLHSSFMENPWERLEQQLNNSNSKAED